MIEKHPETVTRLSPGLVRNHRLHESQQGEIGGDLGQGSVSARPSIGRVYDEQIGDFSTDGTFDPKAVAVLKKSYIEMGLLKDIPDDKEMFTTQFVPVKVGQN